jgi:amino acid transporter
VFNACCALALAQLHLPAALVETEMMLFSAAHVLFLAAFVALRLSQPDAPRPFRVPGQTAAAVACCVPPLLICVATFAANLLPLPRIGPAAFTLRGFACALVLAAVVHRACDARWAAAARRRGTPPERNAAMQQQPSRWAPVCAGHGER